MEAGDRLDQPTFHQRYEAAPQGTRAELIGGVVHLPSPLKRPHGRTHYRVIRWGGDYEDATPGVGPPELVVEVASSTESIDLHGKKADYERYGVREYVDLALRQQRLFWFVSKDEEFQDLPPGADGIVRSEGFPGLWLDAQALLAGDLARVRATLAAGLSSPEHASFVA